MIQQFYPTVLQYPLLSFLSPWIHPWAGIDGRCNRVSQIVYHSFNPLELLVPSIHPLTNIDTLRKKVSQGGNKRKSKLRVLMDNMSDWTENFCPWERVGWSTQSGT
jgi:hypothetical protein